jgi:hypothetical protein
MEKDEGLELLDSIQRNGPLSRLRRGTVESPAFQDRPEILVMCHECYGPIEIRTGSIRCLLTRVSKLRREEEERSRNMEDAF